MKIKSYIHLQDIKIYAYHGVLEQEKQTGNYFIIDLKIYLDLHRAALSDSLDDTVSYAEIYSIVKEEMDIPAHLLEHVAGRIVLRIKKEFPSIHKVKIKLSKLNPPVGGEVEKASVVITI